MKVMKAMKVFTRNICAVSIVLLLTVSAVDANSEEKFDGSGNDAAKISAMKMMDGLSKEERQIFENSLDSVYEIYLLRGHMITDLSDTKIVEMMLEALDGKTAEEINTMAIELRGPKFDGSSKDAARKSMQIMYDSLAGEMVTVFEESISKIYMYYTLLARTFTDMSDEEIDSDVRELLTGETVDGIIVIANELDE